MSASRRGTKQRVGDLAGDIPQLQVIHPGQLRGLRGREPVCEDALERGALGRDLGGVVDPGQVAGSRLDRDLIGQQSRLDGPVPQRVEQLIAHGPSGLRHLGDIGYVPSAHGPPNRLGELPVGEGHPRPHRLGSVLDADEGDVAEPSRPIQAVADECVVHRSECLGHRSLGQVDPALYRDGGGDALDVPPRYEGLIRQHLGGLARLDRRRRSQSQGRG